MYQTVEMRWFFSECPLNESVQFGGTYSDLTELQCRTDWYSMPCHPTCGIKVREGKLETKLRNEQFGLRHLKPMTGQLEAWQKWSLVFDENDQPTDEQLERAGWISVQKSRRLQRFAVSSDGNRLVPVRPDSGCEFELTELRLQNSTYWTVGFEAVGPPSQLEANLSQVAQEVISRGGIEREFSQANSYGYAHWLSQLTGS